VMARSTDTHEGENSTCKEVTMEEDNVEDS
jgi:hypothetical protein